MDALVAKVADQVAGPADRVAADKVVGAVVVVCAVAVMAIAVLNG